MGVNEGGYGRGDPCGRPEPMPPPWPPIFDLLPQWGLATACMVGATLAVALNPCPRPGR